MADSYYCLIDIGGSKILLLLVDIEGRVLFREKVVTPKPKTPDSIVERVNSLLNKAISEAGLPKAGRPEGVGLCIAGFIDHRQGLVHQSPNLNWNQPVRICELMEKTLDCPVIVENDANAAVLGEVFYGAARGYRDVVYVTISTGIGGGLFLDGRLFRGSNGFAGEIGHTKPFGKGRSCKCGGQDCLETWVSGSGISRSAQELWDNNIFSKDQISTVDVFRMAGEGNLVASAIIRHAVDNIGTGIANLVNLFNPACIVIGGGVAGSQDDFVTQIEARVKKEAIRPSVEITALQIVAAELEPEAGIWGMLALLNGKVVK